MTRSSGLRNRLVAAARTPMVRAIVRCLIGCAFTASTTRLDSPGNTQPCKCRVRTSHSHGHSNRAGSPCGPA